MQFFSRLDKFSPEDSERGLLLAGGAAGIAAAFNAPLAGIVFAIEELAGSYEKGVSGTIITTVVLSGFVSLEILGNYAYFGVSSALIGADGWWVIILVSVFCGAMGGFFSLLLLYFIKEIANCYSKASSYNSWMYGAYFIHTWYSYRWNYFWQWPRAGCIIAAWP